ncbi:hypothetical protein KNT81_gp218 [Proteus phage phiP4-3]|uniref:Uncharacterized protein n=1 Tax=Proteus phage phiP4-3 TaxID=2065203 RepID=A0A2I6PFQ4_9CAUD|nr:hypothetical protein KNT81_gp218 [Proteus phage phiP4-3]AUM58553.1 hypothetical protein phiP43_195 [Proteus phage phiP4-3]AZV01207.1 hypothetical protein vBSdyM006_070 [Shigella phage vB_SdyM_006]
MLKENKVYKVNGLDYKFKSDVVYSAMGLNPVAIFSNPNAKDIVVEYNRMTQSYTYSEEMDFKIKYSVYGWMKE